MIYINNIPLLVDLSEVINLLKSQVVISSGISLFNSQRNSGNNLMCTCPFHKDGQERKPSFGISRIDGICHCFTCGWVGSLSEMVSSVFGYDDNGQYGNRWLSRNFLSYDIQVRSPIKIAENRKDTKQEQPVIGFTEEELDEYRYIHPYMYERGLTNEIIEKFDVGYDRNSNSITFPVYRYDKTPAFVARRSVSTKYFNYPPDVEKPVYAGERFVNGDYSYAVICESIFNTLTCWKFGIPSVALLGTGSSYQYEILRKMPVRKFILALDPDDAGVRGSNKLKKFLSSYKLVTQYDIPSGKDINDLDSEVLNLIEYF